MAEANNYSTFTIDTSKKCLIPDINVTLPNKDVIPASLFGDLEDSVLKNIKFNVKEELASSFQKSLDTIEDLTKPIREAVNTFLGKMPGYDHVKGKTLGDTAIYLYTAISQMLVGSENTTANLMDLNAVPLKNLPYRKSMPDVTFGGRNVTINFAYGKCNLFNAQYEVYEPLKALKDYLFPQIKAKGDDKGYYAGLGYLKSNKKIPFEQQVEIQTIQSLVQKLPKEGFLNFTTDVVKALDFIPKFKEATGKLNNILEGQNLSSRVARLKNKIYAKDFEKNQDGKNIFERLGDKANSLFGGGLKTIDVDTFQKSLITIYGAMGREGSAPPPIDEAIIDEGPLDPAIDAQAIALDALTQLKDYALNKGHEGLGPVSFTNTGALDNEDKLLGDPITITEESGKPKITDILGDLINLPYIIAGITSSDLPNEGDNIYFGFAPEYVHNLQDIVSKCKSSSAKLSLNGIVFAEVSVNFDYSDVDMYGYPMSGKLEIKNIWNILDPFATLTIR